MDALGVRGAVASDGASDGRSADPSERTRCRALQEARLGRGSDNSFTCPDPNPMEAEFGKVT